MTVRELNEILGRELGRNPYGEPIYEWAFSEDLFWPAYATGGTTTKDVEATIIGGGTEIVPMTIPEYKRDRMTHNLRHQWCVTKWFPPEELPEWNSRFPGADYPARGYRIHTNWYNAPNVLPTQEDTNCLVWAVRKQLGMNYVDLYNEMDAEMAKAEKAREAEVNDEVRDAFTAYLNLTPGKRGGSISMPLTAQDRR